VVLLKQWEQTKGTFCGKTDFYSSKVGGGGKVRGKGSSRENPRLSKALVSGEATIQQGQPWERWEKKTYCRRRYSSGTEGEGVDCKKDQLQKGRR